MCNNNNISCPQFLAEAKPMLKKMPPWIDRKINIKSLDDNLYCMECCEKKYAWWKCAVCENKFCGFHGDGIYRPEKSIVISHTEKIPENSIDEEIYFTIYGNYEIYLCGNHKHYQTIKYN